MRLTYEDKRKRTIKDKEIIEFSSFSSYHLFAITARTKSEKQLGKNADDDEDLTVQINDKAFPVLNSDRLKDSPTAFSGGRLHNLAKTIYFLTFLKGKNHTITLETDEKPNTAFFEGLEVYTLNIFEETLTLEINQQAEDGDRRSWLTFALDNLPLKSVTPTVTFSRRKRDSDDVKIKIDGKTQGSVLTNIQHFLWRFVGSFLPWSSPIKTETETFAVHLPRGLHYIEFDADRIPILENVVFDFGQELPIPTGIPTVDNPKWTGDFHDDTAVMLLTRAIYGEAGGGIQEAKIAVGWAIRNRVEDGKNRWGITYHGVILAKYQYEPFNNPGTDPFKKITQPQLDDPLEKQAWLDSYKAAKLVFFDEEADPTQAANHFYVPSNQPKPDWADEEKFTVQIGVTRFYKL